MIHPKKVWTYTRNRCIIIHVRQSKALTKGGRKVDEMNITLALLRAILELIDKAETLEELRESVKRIMGEEKVSPPSKEN